MWIPWPELIASHHWGVHSVFPAVPFSFTCPHVYGPHCVFPSHGVLAWAPPLTARRTGDAQSLPAYRRFWVLQPYGAQIHRWAPSCLCSSPETQIGGPYIHRMSDGTGHGSAPFGGGPCRAPFCLGTLRQMITATLAQYSSSSATAELGTVCNPNSTVCI